MDQSPTTAIEIREGGALVVVKRSGGATGIDRMRREAQILEVARHPGVVELVATTDARDEPALVSSWVGRHTLAVISLLPLGQAAGLMAALAETVADLHDLGIAHQAITADHVLLAADGRPVLCGFGHARLLTGEVQAGERPTEEDVAALGRLLRSLIGDDVDLEPIPERRGWRRRPLWQGYERRALQTLADQATSDERQLRPTARALASAIHDTMPNARIAPAAAAPEIPNGVIGESGPPPLAVPVRDIEATDLREAADPPPPRRRSVHIGPLASPDPLRPAEHTVRSRRILPILAGVVGVALLLFGLSELRNGLGTTAHTSPITQVMRSPTPPGTTAVQPTPKATASPTTRASVTTVTPQVTRTDPQNPARSTRTSRRRASTSGKSPPLSVRTPRCPTSALPGVDLDADGCPDRIHITGAIVAAGDTRYRVGRAGDHVVLGDWDCDGRATPAVLRPTTGEIYVFNRWAVGSRAVTVRPTARVRHARALEVGEPNGHRCSRLTVRTTEGRPVRISTRSGA